MALALAGFALMSLISFGPNPAVAAGVCGSNLSFVSLTPSHSRARRPVNVNLQIQVGRFQGHGPLPGHGSRNVFHREPPGHQRFPVGSQKSVQRLQPRRSIPEQCRIAAGIREERRELHRPGHLDHPAHGLVLSGSADSNPQAHAHANTKAHTYANAKADTNANSQAHAHANPKANSNANSQANANTHAQAHANTHAQATPTPTPTRRRPPKPTPTPTPTPKPTPTPRRPDADTGSDPLGHPTPTPIPTAIPTATPAPTATPSPSPTPSAAPVTEPPVTPSPTPTPGRTDPPTPQATPSPTPSASPSPSPSAAPSVPVLIGGGGLPPGSFPTGVPTIHEVSFDPISTTESALLALLFLLLAAFPGQLFNKTYEENQEEIARMLARGGVVFGALGRRFRVLEQADRHLQLRDPERRSLWLPESVIRHRRPVDRFAYRHPGWAAHRHPCLRAALARAQRTAAPRPRPGSGRPHDDPCGHLCVISSRFTDFQPGYLYGLVAGYVFARDLDSADEARAHVWTVMWMLAISLAAWFALPLVDRYFSAQPLLDVLLSAMLATIFVAGLEGSAVRAGAAALPARRGRIPWRRSVWAVLFLVAAFLFAWIMLQPTVGYLGSTRTSPLIPAVILFVTFGACSVAFWAYFRFRPEREEPQAAE